MVSIEGERGAPIPASGSHEADSRLEVVDDRGEVSQPVRAARGREDIAARRVHARTDSDLCPIVRRRLAEQSDHHGSGARKPPPPSLLGPPRYAMPTVLEHHADQRPATPQVPREEVRKDPPGCAALGSAAATEHEHLGPTWPTDFAREDALAAVVYVHDADLAGAAATQLEERGVAQCRLMLLERGHIAGEERSPLFARTGSIEVCARKTAASEGRRRFTRPAPSAFFSSRKR